MKKTKNLLNWKLLSGFPGLTVVLLLSCSLALAVCDNPAVSCIYGLSGGKWRIHNQEGDVCDRSVVYISLCAIGANQVYRRFCCVI